MKKPNPGSRDATMRGCTCGVRVNNHGLGHTEGGETYFFPDLDCPLHGVDAVSRDATTKRR